MTAAAALMALIKDGSLFLGLGSSWQTLLLNIVSPALWAVIGFGFGILIQNMIASVPSTGPPTPDSWCCSAGRG